MLKLDLDAIRRVARAEVANRSGAIILAGVGLATGLASALFTPGIGGCFRFGAIVVMPIAYFIVTFIAVGIIHVMATVAGGQGQYLALFRCTALLSFVNIVGAIPKIGGFLSFVASIWNFVVFVPILEEVYSLPRRKAQVIVGILAAIALFFVGIAFVMAKFAPAGMR